MTVGRQPQYGNDGVGWEQAEWIGVLLCPDGRWNAYVFAAEANASVKSGTKLVGGYVTWGVSTSGLDGQFTKRRQVPEQREGSGNEF